MFVLGLHEHQAGNLCQAEQIYRQILQVAPDHADAHHLLGVLAYQRGNNEQAAKMIRHALSLDPTAAAYYSNLGLALDAMGKVDEAIASYERALDLQPDFAEALNNLGKALLQKGNLDEAVGRFQLAVSLRSDFPEAQSNLATGLLNQGNIDDAVSHCMEALRSRTDLPGVHCCLGNARLRQGKLCEAIASFRQAVRLNPMLSEAYVGLGYALEQQSKLDEAVHAYQQALRLNPRGAEVHNGLGHVRKRQGMLDEAISCFYKALDLNPGFPQAHQNLGSSLLEKGRPDLAMPCYQEALRLDSTLATAQTSYLFCLNYDPDANLDQVFEAHCRWGRLHERKTLPAHANDRCPGRRLRIGYASPDFRFHPLARYFEPVLANHDSEQVDVFCYAEVANPDSVTGRLQKLAHGWRWTTGKTDSQVADCVRSDNIDIFVDLAGHTRNSRLPVFAHKPAPVQATWFGYLNTTGLAAIDYRLTDDILHPPGQPVRGTEELLRLPGGMCCFAPPADAPPVTTLPASDWGHLTFGSLSSVFKLNNRVFDLWCQVLKAVPTSRFLMFHHTLVGAARDHVHRQFIERGIEQERLDLRQGSYAAGYLAVYGEIDISLDAFPCTGGVTTCESLWMGVPVVSLCGNCPAGRNSTALLTRAGLTDWVAQTPQQYVTITVEKARDLDGLTQLRSGLRCRAHHTLCDAPKFTRVLENAYRTMWRRWCAGK
jgi:protein O-GlcNAc transferase